MSSNTLELNANTGDISLKNSDGTTTTLAP